MPLVINVGYPASKSLAPPVIDQWRQVAPELYCHLNSPTITTSFTVPCDWGLWPLSRLSSYIALDRPLPEPWRPDLVPDYSAWSEYLDRRDERLPVKHRSALLEDKEGIFLPVPPEDIDSLDIHETDSIAISSLPQLVREIILLKAAFRLDPTYTDGIPYRIEQDILKVLESACEVSASMMMPLFSTWQHTAKPIDQQMNSWDLHIYGFDRFDSVSLSQDVRSLVVVFPSRYRYEIPIDYLKSWFSEFSDSGLVHFATLARFDGSQVLIRFADDKMLLLSPVDVLMRCEPSYDEFGDFPEGEKARLQPWLNRVTDFRRVS